MAKRPAKPAADKSGRVLQQILIGRGASPVDVSDAKYDDLNTEQLKEQLREEHGFVGKGFENQEWGFFTTDGEPADADGPVAGVTQEVLLLKPVE